MHDLLLAKYTRLQFEAESTASAPEAPAYVPWIAYACTRCGNAVEIASVYVEAMDPEQTIGSTEAAPYVMYANEILWGCESCEIYTTHVVVREVESATMMSGDEAETSRLSLQ